MITLSINIELPYGGFYYNLSYFLSALVIIGYTLYWGISKKISLIPWTLSIVSILILFIVGTRLFSMNKEDWQLFFDSGIIHLSNGRTVLGGIILAIPAAIFCKYYFKLHFDFSKPFAFVLPIVVVIMRIGCLLVGCCYGTSCDLPWAIRYGINTPVFISQVNKGLISMNASHSMPVHPSQVYDIIFYLLIFFFIIKLKNNFKANHSLFYLVIVSRFIERFFLEFVREGESNNVFGIDFFGLKIVQWTLLILIAIFIFIIYYREKNLAEPNNSFQIIPIHSARIIWFTLLISALLILVKPWMMHLEMAVIDLLVLITIVSLFVYEIKQIRFVQFRFAPISLILICFVLMSQTVDMNPIKYSQNDTLIKKLNDYFEFGGGYSFGSYNFKNTQQVQVGSTSSASGGSGCSSNGSSSVPQYVYLDHSHQQSYGMYTASGAYKHYLENKKYAITIGGNIGLGKSTDNDHVKVQGTDTLTYYRSSTFTNINPYIAFDSKIIGIGVGIHTISRSPSDSQNVVSASIAPSFYLRCGDPRLFYISTFFNNRLEDGFPVTLNDKNPNTAVRIELGSQFNSDFLLFKMGVSQFGYYLAPSFYMNKYHFIFSPYFEFISGNNEVSAGQHYGINLSYRIPIKAKGY